MKGLIAASSVTFVVRGQMIRILGRHHHVEAFVEARPAAVCGACRGWRRGEPTAPCPSTRKVRPVRPDTAQTSTGARWRDARPPRGWFVSTQSPSARIFGARTGPGRSGAPGRGRARRRLTAGGERPPWSSPPLPPRLGQSSGPPTEEDIGLEGSRHAVHIPPTSTHPTNDSPRRPARVDYLERD